MAKYILVLIDSQKKIKQAQATFHQKFPNVEPDDLQIISVSPSRLAPSGPDLGGWDVRTDHFYGGGPEYEPLVSHVKSRLKSRGAIYFICGTEFPEGWATAQIEYMFDQGWWDLLEVVSPIDA